MITPTCDEIKKIEVTARKQSKCTRWYEEHNCRITASNFGKFCKGSVTSNKVNTLLYNGFESKFKQCYHLG